MTSNGTSLAQAQGMTAKELATLPTDQLACLLEESAAYKADATLIADRLTDALALKFDARATALRQSEGKDTGRVSFDDGDHIVRADLPKKIDWDQSKLEMAVHEIGEWGDPTEFVTLKYIVSETKYNAWPSGIRDLFTAARTVGTGKPSYVIERRAA